MRQNVGTTDRIIRLIVGIIVIILGIVFNSWWGLIGVLLFLTGLVGRCGLYLPFKINTCKIKQPPPADIEKEQGAGSAF